MNIKRQPAKNILWKKSTVYKFIHGVKYHIARIVEKNI